MGSSKAFLLSLFACAITVGPGCTPATVTGNANCDDLYGSLEGYELCEQTDSSCIFSQSETPEISCAAICAFSGAACLKAYGREGGACDPNDTSPCPPGDGFAQFCSFADGNTCVNVCQGEAFTGGCETDMDCTAPLTCDNDQQLGGSTCTCAEETGGTPGERDACDLGGEIPCDQPSSDTVCECGRPPNGGTGGTGGAGGGGGTGGNGGGCPNNTRDVRFVFTPSNASAPFPVTTCAWFDCQGPTNGCALQVFDIEGGDRFFQFLTTSAPPFTVDTNICFAFDFVVDEPGAPGPGQGRGLANQISFLTGRQFGVWDPENPTPFASGDYAYRDGSETLGTFDFFEDGFMGFTIPAQSCPP
jgi:hypothetical protein